MTHWSNTASLRSISINNNEEHSQRLRRWSHMGDNDEVEIPLNDTISDDVTLSTSIVNSTLLNFETIESNSSIIQNFDDLINSTISVEEFNLTTIEVSTIDDVNTTIIYPLLRQDLIDENQTNISITEEVLQDTTTNSQTIITNLTDHSSSHEFQSTQLPLIVNQTTDEIEESTVSYNQTNSWSLLLNDQTETISLNDSLIVTTSSWDMSQKDAIITDEEFHINETELIMIENNQTSNLTLKSLPIPICDLSCECSKECPYGFEILNDTCECDPPCKNYQCFGNDTCTVNDKGQALCQPENGTKHDRPIRCYQPRVAGYHDNNIRYYNRWYYHPDQDTCHLFVYRGLGGNENNFQTLQECHLECITCAPKPDPGECFGQFDMWYYDNKNNECAQFKYSGCKGNENKFLKKEQCIDACINRTLNL